MESLRMQGKVKKVLCIGSEPSFIEQQKKKLSSKELNGSFYHFSSFTEAFDFIETHVIGKNNKLHYIILDEKATGKQLAYMLEKFWGLNNFLKKPDLIFITEDKDVLLRNKIMQYPFVSAFLVKPIPSNYIEFLMTGQTA